MGQGKRVSPSLYGEIWELMDQGTSLHSIAQMTGITYQTITRYKRMRDMGITDPLHMSVTNKVITCIEHGLDAVKIRNLLVIKEEALDNILEAIGYDASSGTYRWDDIGDLIEQWRWKIPTDGRARRSKSGYRIVYVGEKSGFRTPYRPDGVFR